MDPYIHLVGFGRTHRLEGPHKEILMLYAASLQRMGYVIWKAYPFTISEWQRMRAVEAEYNTKVQGAVDSIVDRIIE